MLLIFVLNFNKYFPNMFYIILQNFEENDLRSFYQSLLYINSFVLAPEMIMKIDFKILCLQMKI